MEKNKLETIDIKGKKYVTVNTRLLEFVNNKDYKGWYTHEYIEKYYEKTTEVVKTENDLTTKQSVTVPQEVIVVCEIFNKDREMIATAYAHEVRDSSFINKTSFIENAFTSALGRALGYLGIGVIDGIASADEVANAIVNQSQTAKVDNRPWLTQAQYSELLKSDKETVEKAMTEFRMKTVWRQTLNAKFNN